MASVMFDFPHPFGPTTAVRPFVGKLISVLWAKDLNPNIFNFVICTIRQCSKKVCKKRPYPRRNRRSAELIVDGAVLVLVKDHVEASSIEVHVRSVFLHHIPFNRI